MSSDEKWDEPRKSARTVPIDSCIDDYGLSFSVELFPSVAEEMNPGLIMDI